MPQWASPVPVAKATYYDRNARPSYHGYVVTVAPHSETVRVNYTVPDPYAAFWEVVSNYVGRSAAGASAGDCGIRVVAVNVFSVSEVMDLVNFNNNTAGFQTSDTITGFGFLGPGDTVQVSTYDGSSGGSVTYRTGIKGTEFEY